MLKSYLFRVGGLGGFLLLLSLLMLPSKTARADLLNLKLSDPLQPQTTLKNIKISPDGQYALFVGDILVEDAYELYSVPIDGSEAPTLLSGGLMPAGAEVESYEISPDSSRVVYLADQDTADVDELYSVPITGGPISKLNPPIAGTGDGVWGPTFSQDSSRVVFLVSWQTANVHELFSVPAAGGTPVRLNGDLPLNGTLSEFKITPDDSEVVYIASQDTTGMFELYTVPLAGGASEKLSDPMAAGGTIWSFDMSLDGDHVVYTADENGVSQWEIFSLSLTNPAASPVKLNPPLGANADVIYNNFKISPDGNHVVYLADQLLDGFYFHYSVPIDGGTAVQLTNLASGVPETSWFYPFEISPDSGRVVFISKLMGTRELFSVPLTGGTVTKLNDPIIPASGHVEKYQISPDSGRVVYLANQQTANSQELYSVPIGGGPVAKLNSALPNFGNVHGFQISSDSQRVAYVADQQVVFEYEIFSVPLADGVITQLNPPLVAGGGVHLKFQISPNNNHVLYVADQETENVPELFVTFEESPSPGGAYKVYIPFLQK